MKEITDEGSGVLSANKEVQFRQTELFLIEQLDRLNRVHTARHDSGLNPSERLDAAIGSAVADGGTIQWNYNQQKLTPDEFQDRERMEANCWEVCEDLQLRLRVNDAPAPSQGFIRCFVSKHLFFSDTDFLREHGVAAMVWGFKPQ